MKYPDKVYLNGKIVHYKDANISVFDRGFIFGDGIYEVMVQIAGSFFYEKDHLERLKDGLSKINIDFNVDSLQPEIKKLLKAVNLTSEDCMLYMQITRGVAPRQHAFPKNIAPTVFFYAVPKVLPSINPVHAKVITREDFRWSRCDIKMTSLLGNVMLNETAMENDCFETILVRDGFITEASHCNVFFVKDDVVYTHATNNHILDGITRKVVIELCEKLDIGIVEEAILSKDIFDMDEAFLTGTSTQIASIQKIDGHTFYKGEVCGKTTRRLQEAFLELKASS
ncbi:aminotransferase class IV [Maribacter sp. CXY002]|uniref:aminotransferase class IV n=1 Tax=Maribacter luteocoastalis TaxID=3407671 RepID=UPI003B6847DA